MWRFKRPRPIAFWTSLRSRRRSNTRGICCGSNRPSPALSTPSAAGFPRHSPSKGFLDCRERWSSAFRRRAPKPSDRPSGSQASRRPPSPSSAPISTGSRLTRIVATKTTKSAKHTKPNWSFVRVLRLRRELRGKYSCGEPGIPRKLSRRAKSAGISLEKPLIEGLETYYQLLTKWNAKINLTAFRLTPEGEDDAIDRLLIEPVVAARYVPENARTLLDAGSGGGSPAIPLKLASRSLALRMVEVKTRKAVFLREAVRALNLKDAEVETSRFEELLPRAELHEALDLVSIRAVRIETSNAQYPAGVPASRRKTPAFPRCQQERPRRFSSAAPRLDGDISAGRFPAQQTGSS